MVQACHSCAGFNLSPPWDGLVHKAGSHRDHLIHKLLDRAGFVYCPNGRIASKCDSTVLVTSFRLVFQVVAIRAGPLRSYDPLKPTPDLSFQ